MRLVVQSDNVVRVPPPLQDDGTVTTVQDFLGSYFGFHYKLLGLCVSVLLVYILFFG